MGQQNVRATIYKKERVGSSPSLDWEAYVHHDLRMSGRYSMHCWPSLIRVSRSASADQ